MKNLRMTWWQQVYDVYGNIQQDIYIVLNKSNLPHPQRGEILLAESRIEGRSYILQETDLALFSLPDSV